VKNVVLTVEGLEKIKQELADLKVRRKGIIDRIQTAKEFGDLSENAEYDDARNEQSFVEGRIQELDEMVKQAKVVARQAGGTIVTLGSKVTFQVEGEKEKETFEVVGVNESDPLNGKISVESPIGSALMGVKKGETIVVSAPGGKLTYKVLEIN
jgi:transcription elongation factor GreA